MGCELSHSTISELSHTASQPHPTEKTNQPNPTEKNGQPHPTEKTSRPNPTEKNGKPRPTEKTGRISEAGKNSFIILSEGRELPAKLKGSFYKKEADQLPVVGDYVTFLYNDQGDSTILSVGERKSFLKRPDQAKTGVMQYMAANVDYCFIVTSLNEEYNYKRIARYVSIVLSGGAVPVVILTKSDLCGDAESFVREVEQISDKVRVHAVSALCRTGLEKLEEFMKPGITICLMGSSGTGKSTLINAIIGEAIMKTSAIREADSRGRHTTTHRKLIELSDGVCIIDTPGMREMGMAEVQDGIDDTFSDIIALERQCRFRNCRHESEPGCAVKAALQSGALSMERYRLFQSLGMENARNYAGKKKNPGRGKKTGRNDHELFY